MTSDLTLFKTALTQAGVNYSIEGGVGITTNEPEVHIIVKARDGEKQPGYPGQYLDLWFRTTGELVEFGLWD